MVIFTRYFTIKQNCKLPPITHTHTTTHTHMHTHTANLNRMITLISAIIRYPKSEVGKWLADK